MPESEQDTLGSSLVADLREKQTCINIKTAAHLGCTAARAEMADATTTDLLTMVLSVSNH
jgi:hypothetical protein